MRVGIRTEVIFVIIVHWINFAIAAGHPNLHITCKKNNFVKGESEREKREREREREEREGDRKGGREGYLYRERERILIAIIKERASKRKMERESANVCACV